jgi:signal transduction histidine kinase
VSVAISHLKHHRGGVQDAAVQEALFALQQRIGRSLDLTVVDDGKRFDVARARQNSGLGLLSIEERARLVGGELIVDSYVQQGTIVHASIPVPPAPHRAVEFENYASEPVRLQAANAEVKQ